MKNANTPAMPSNCYFGLTKREYFAGLMMQAEKIHHGAHNGYSYSAERAAQDAVVAADVLLAELEK